MTKSNESEITLEAAKSKREFTYRKAYKCHSISI